MIIVVALRFTLAAVAILALAACGSRNQPESSQLQPRSETRPAPPPNQIPVPPPNQIEDTRPVIAAFGDSLSAGFGVEPGRSFPDDIQRMLDAEHYSYRVVNMGVSGDTTTDGVERLPAVLAIHPAIVLLEFGGNDGLRGLPVTSTEKNLATMTVAFRNAGAQVVLAGMTLPRNYGPEYIQSFERVYIDLAKRYKLVRIPFLLEGVGGHPDLMQADGIHPTEEGAQIVANNVMNYLRPLLKANSSASPA